MRIDSNGYEVHKYKDLNRPANTAMEHVGYYVASKLIPCNPDEVTLIYSVNDTSGGEYGKYPTMREAKIRLKEVSNKIIFQELINY